MGSTNCKGDRPAAFTIFRIRHATRRDRVASAAGYSPHNVIFLELPDTRNWSDARLQHIRWCDIPSFLSAFRLPWQSVPLRSWLSSVPPSFSLASAPNGAQRAHPCPVFYNPISPCALPIFCCTLPAKLSNLPLTPSHLFELILPVMVLAEPFNTRKAPFI